MDRGIYLYSWSMTKMDSSWQRIYFCNQQHKIEIVRSVLEDHDIKSVIVDRRDSNYTMLGDIEIFVRQEDAIIAKIIIEQNEL